MYQDLKKFFEEHPEANECHTALGYFLEDKEEAQALLAGVQGHEVQTITKDAFDSMSEVPVVEAPEDHKLVAQFKKLSLEKMKPALEKQKTLVEKLTAGQDSAEDKEKATAALNFHDGIYKSMSEAFEAKSLEANQ
jgi:23S rRNA U2552 (ribose-2'-O)-methylase RlmE/FtsJ